MWNPDWLRNKSFWVEMGLFLFFILFLVTVAVVKPNLPGSSGTVTPTIGPKALVFYYSETDTSTAITRVWQSTTEDINTRQELAAFSYSVDNPLMGRLSPDGSQIAMLIPAKDAADATSGELWLLGTDGSTFQKAIGGDFSWFAWKQDSQSLALFSQNSLYDPAEQSSGLKTRLSKLNLGTGEVSVIQDDDSSLDAKPLGWSAGGNEFVLMTLANNGQWSVTSILVDNGSRIARFSLSENDLLRNAWLSPSGAYILDGCHTQRKGKPYAFQSGRQAAI